MVSHSVVLFIAELNSNLEILVGDVSLVDFVLVVELSFEVVASKVAYSGWDIDGHAEDDEGKGPKESTNGGGGAPECTLDS